MEYHREPMLIPNESIGIGSLNEKPLHAALKQWYAGAGDRFEVPVDGFVIDIVQGDVLVEIQTKSFTSMRRKLVALTASHRVRLLYPIAQEKWIVKTAPSGTGNSSRRKSPKRCGFEHVFEELVAFPKLIGHPNFSVMVVLIHEEEARRHDPRRAWRRKGWVTDERRLLKVVEHRLFSSPQDLAALIPSGVPEPFTTSDLATALNRPRRLAQQMAYCLRECGAIREAGKRSRSILYERAGGGGAKRG